MTEEYELATFDRHNLNFDNVALGRLPTNVTTDPSVKPLRELAYLPKGVMDPHELPKDSSKLLAKYTLEKYFCLTNEDLTPFLMTVPLQLLAYHVASLKNCDIDKPRNLAKSVTVE